jgi:hypothetical protein
MPWKRRRVVGKEGRSGLEWRYNGWRGVEKGEQKAEE